MNELATIENSAGLLRPVYDTGESPMDIALRKKRKKLAETKIGLKPEEENEGSDG